MTADTPRGGGHACVNFLLAGYAYTRGGLAFDPSLPITDAKLSTSNAIVAYARALDIFGTLPVHRET